MAQCWFVTNCSAWNGFSVTQVFCAGRGEVFLAGLYTGLVGVFLAVLFFRDVTCSHSSTSLHSPFVCPSGVAGEVSLVGFSWIWAFRVMEFLSNILSRISLMEWSSVNTLARSADIVRHQKRGSHIKIWLQIQRITQKVAVLDRNCVFYHKNFRRKIQNTKSLSPKCASCFHGNYKQLIENLLRIGG